MNKAKSPVGESWRGFFVSAVLNANIVRVDKSTIWFQAGAFHPARQKRENPPHVEKLSAAHWALLAGLDRRTRFH